MTLQQSSTFAFQACMACEYHFSPAFCCCGGASFAPAAARLDFLQNHPEQEAPTPITTPPAIFCILIDTKSTFYWLCCQAVAAMWKEVLSWVPVGVMTHRAPRFIVLLRPVHLLCLTETRTSLLTARRRISVCDSMAVVRRHERRRQCCGRCRAPVSRISALLHEPQRVRIRF